MRAKFMIDERAGNSQEARHLPIKLLQENKPGPSTTVPNNIDPSDIRKQIRAGAQTPVSSNTFDVLTATDPTFEATTLKIRKQHDTLNKAAEITSELLRGQLSARDDGKREIAAYEDSWSKYNPWSSRFYERELIERKKKDIEANNTYAESLEVREKELKSALDRSQTTLNEAVTKFKESQELRKEAEKALEHARELASANKEQQTQSERERAKELATRSVERLQEAQKLQQEAIRSLQHPEESRSLPELATAEYQQSNRSSKIMTEETTLRLEKTEDYARITRNALIVVGATVATGGIAGLALTSGYGVVGAGVAGVMGGTSTGTGIGIASTAAEQGRAVVESQKTAQAALDDGRHQTVQDVQLALVSSVGNFSGIALLARLAPRLTVLLGGSKVAATTSEIVSGSAAAVPPTLLEEGLNVTINGEEASSLGELTTRLVKNTAQGGLKTALSILGNAVRSALPHFNGK